MFTSLIVLPSDCLPITMTRTGRRRDAHAITNRLCETEETSASRKREYTRPPTQEDPTRDDSDPQAVSWGLMSQPQHSSKLSRSSRNLVAALFMAASTPTVAASPGNPAALTRTSPLLRLAALYQVRTRAEDPVRSRQPYSNRPTTRYRSSSRLNVIGRTQRGGTDCLE